jgi:hypothetical protein
VQLKGTADKPIFVRGASNTEIFMVTNLSGGSYNVMNSEYLIVEHALFKGIQIQIGQYNSHICFRHCEIDGNNKNPGVYVWTQKDTFIPGQKKQHIVFYGNLVHDCGAYPDPIETVCAFMIDNATQNLWLVDNHIFENGEDGIQIMDRTSLPDSTPKADRVFIGRNIFHHDIENAIDAKGSTNVIISQNEMYVYYVVVSASNGDAIRINDFGYNKRPLGNRWDIGAYENTGLLGIIPDGNNNFTNHCAIKVFQGNGRVTFLIIMPVNEKGILEIYNPAGKLVQRYSVKQSTKKFSFPPEAGENISNGFYLARLKTSSGRLTTNTFVLTY